MTDFVGLKLPDSCPCCSADIAEKRERLHGIGAGSGPLLWVQYTCGAAIECGWKDDKPENGQRTHVTSGCKSAVRQALGIG